MTTAQVHRGIDYPSSKPKLADELRASGLVEQAGVGGNWTIKEDVIDPQKERTADRLAVEYGLKEGDA